MEDRRTAEEIIRQINGMDQNNSNNIEHITSIDLLLSDDNNGTVKDARVSEKFNALKRSMEEANQLTKEFVEILRRRS
ncbi:hypothetical protein HNQ80_001392 [Anaerosolibacter carboniphilus]|uniref:Uncharacterized protein n=1 Tax=Anaerosolibacter carboniphilus TaxID=1417629 RepID=A0A841KPF4_9FIRM|nr:hypothetical protein [Anaerosolibacter carboniphilus]MBB6215303.1 hypothetical protein [Anaerosolibacter carboniphilus]